MIDQCLFHINSRFIERRLKFGHRKDEDLIDYFSKGRKIINIQIKSSLYNDTMI
jgi:hypothetical protein